MTKRILSAVFYVIFLINIGFYGTAFSAQYAGMVTDARSGEILHSENADKRLSPASLTKMMTLYIAFEAIKNGEISEKTLVKISNKAASEPPSKLGLRAGQKIRLEYLIRAAAIMSANDAATAIGEAISGSEAAFARRMNKTAKALGMTRTTFKNAHGLTEEGHLSTARDMTILGRQLIYGYPGYYSLFSRITDNTGVRNVRHTNRKFLSNYKGADGIKTGYTRAAGFNLVASAERGNERIIGTIFGGKSTASRNKKMVELLDLGFKKAPSTVSLSKPPNPIYTNKIIVAKKYVIKPTKRPYVSGSLTVITDMVQQVSFKINEAIIATQSDLKETKPILPGIKTQIYTPTQRPGFKTKAIIKTTSQPFRVITRSIDNGPKKWAINVGAFTTKDRAEKQLIKTAMTEIDLLKSAKRRILHHPRGWQANFINLSKTSAEVTCKRLELQGHNCRLLAPGV
ncbi:MAG: D-alanyl-D-alanine carboxypeptidase [Proteobacteria bacterium]|nr:D-alanyl-D-alanine carboxypeptidase [Pseudomonadota bacterium]